MDTYYYCINTFSDGNPIQIEGLIKAESEESAIRKLIDDEVICPNAYEILELSAYCEFCQEPYEHYAKYYISTGYTNDPHLFTLRKEDSVGGIAIEYCPLCGRKLNCGGTNKNNILRG